MSTAHGTCAVLTTPRGLCSTSPADLVGAADHETRAEAAMTAGAHAFVSELPEGYHTPVGRDGVALSASQLLRLAVAGLLVSDPRTVVIDDPTAGMAPADEAAALTGVEWLLRGREVSVVSASPAVRAAAERAADPCGGTPVPPRAPGPPPDAGLPPAGRLLDPGAMSPLLAGLLEQECLDVRVHTVRYKPAGNLVVQYGVRTEAGWSAAVAFASSAADLERKARKLARTPLARRVAARTPALHPIGHLAEVSALVQWMPLDVRLPVVGDDAARLTRRLARKGIDVGGAAEPELLRYWPRRRAVIRFGDRVLKVYRDQKDFDQALHALRHSRRLRQVLVPAYEGRLKARRVTLQEWLPGGGPALAPGRSEPAARVIAELHADRLLQARTTTATDLLRKARSRGAFVTSLDPGLGPEVADVLTRLAAAVPAPASLVTSHGNFHAGQLLATPRGLALVDLDRMCRADPAYDLASFAAHVAFGHESDDETVGATVDSLLTGYGARPPALAWYLSACLLRRAAVPFRYQHERWPEAAARLVRLAGQVLR